MTDYSFWDRIKAIFEMIFSNGFFISLFAVLVFTVVILIANKKLQSKLPKYLIAIGYIVIAVFVLIKYGSFVFSINDSAVEKIFDAVYFPNLVVYSSMLLITLLLLCFNFIYKNFSSLTKICSSTCFGIIWFMFVLILDTAKTNNINVYEIKEIYENKTMMILMQSSMSIFIIWCLLLIMNFTVRKISEKLENGINISTDILNKKIVYTEDEEVRNYTDKEFEIGFLNQIKQNKNNELMDILKHKDIDF